MEVSHNTYWKNFGNWSEKKMHPKISFVLKSLEVSYFFFPMFKHIVLEFGCFVLMSRGLDKKICFLFIFYLLIYLFLFLICSVLSFVLKNWGPMLNSIINEFIQ